MAKSDEQETTDRRQQILEAALKVFSTKGFHKATNKDIATAAGGISPGLIYWYFKDKQDLFMSIIRERATIVHLAEHPGQLMDMPPREGLALIGRTYLSIFRIPSNIAIFRILLGEAIRFPQLAELFYKGIGVRFFDMMTSYLQHQIELGRLRPHDTMIAARSFLGMFVVQVIAREVVRQPEAATTTDEQIIEVVVDIFLRGLEREQS